MSFFRALQDSAFTQWFLGSESIWTYPTVLTLHTVGLAALVGASTVLHLRVLGVGASMPPSRLRWLGTVIWPAFGINLASGVLLFVTQAADRVVQPLFYVKLASIGVALWLGIKAKRAMGGDLDASVSHLAALRGSAVAALALWVAAIVAGRLMAYFSG